jgi:tetratricopeptide (TPR) repeat protein
MTGRFERSIALFERTLREAEAAHDRAVCFRFRLLLTNALIDAGRFGEAELQLAPLLGEGTGTDTLECARIYWTRSRLHTLQGRHELASTYAHRVLELLEGSEDAHYRARACQMLAHIELACGRADEALVLIERAEEFLGPAAGALDRGRLLLERAGVRLAVGQHLEAAALAQTAAAVLAEVDAHDRGRAYLLLADVFAQAGEHSRALEIYELAEELLADAPSRFMVEALQRHAELLEQEHLRDDAILLLKRALALQRSWRAPPPMTF